MERDWGFARAAAVKGFTKSPASMNAAGAVGYTAYLCRDRTFDARHNLMNIERQ